MSEKILVKEARRRAEIFKNLPRYLRMIVKTVKELDKGAELYLFGSVAEGKHLLSSDIDILVVTDLQPAEVLSALWSRGIKDPFEIHVITREMVEVYRKRGRLVRIAAAIAKGNTGRCVKGSYRGKRPVG